MSYDPKCYWLAVDFLEDHARVTEQLYAKLAQRIQTTVDDFLEDLDSEIEAKRDEAIDRKMDERWSERDEWKHEAAEQQRLK